MKTITLFEQIKKSREIYDAALSRIDDMSDVELLNLFASAATVARVLGFASDALADIARCAGVTA